MSASAGSEDATPAKRAVTQSPSSGLKRRRTKLQFQDAAGDAVPADDAALLEELHDIIHGAPAPFACGGELRIPEVPAVALAGSGGRFAITPPALRAAKSSTPSCLWMGVSKREEQQYVEDQAKALQGLLARMTPAAFGHGQETKVDPSVRSALQLKAEAFAVNIPAAALAPVLKNVQEQLQISTELVAELYALNVYQKGGHFARHKDTPRGQDMLGTLVVCLPAYFEGGAMLIEQGPDRKAFFGSFGDRFSPQAVARRSQEQVDWSRRLEWCAFFADVDHLVEPVRTGLRITVSYLLRRKDGGGASSEIPYPLSEPDQHRLMREAFARAVKSPVLADGRSLGFPCFFLYTNTEVFPKNGTSEAPLSANVLKKLKGRDAVVGQSAVAAGLQVRLVPYLSHDYSGEDGGPGEIPLKRFPAKKKVPRRMSDDTIERHFDAELDEDRRREGQPDVWVMDMEKAAGKQAGETEWNAEGYFGNEASSISFYVAAGLHVSME